MREVFLEQGAQAAAAWVNEEIFAGVVAEQMVPDLIGLGRTWQPDLVIRDLNEFAGYIAAEVLNLPHATVEVGMFQPYFWRKEEISRKLDNLRVAYGIPRDRNLERLYAFLYLSFVPPQYQDAEVSLPTTSQALRWMVFDRSGEETLPSWLTDLPAQPNIYVTLGTAVNRRRDVFNTILEGLGQEALNLIVTIGRNQSPTVFGTQPPNIHIESYIPQSLILPNCDLVVSHGGFNTVLDSISYGLPQVIIPLGGDQPDHARRSELLQIARVIAPEQLTPKSVHRVVLEVLHDARYRRNAERLRDTMSKLPGLEYGVSLLERLVRRTSH